MSMFPKKKGFFDSQRTENYYRQIYARIRLWQGGEAAEKFYQAAAAAWKEKQVSEQDDLPTYQLTKEDIERLAAQFKHSK